MVLLHYLWKRLYITASNLEPGKWPKVFSKCHESCYPFSYQGAKWSMWPKIHKIELEPFRFIDMPGTQCISIDITLSMRVK